MVYIVLYREGFYSASLPLMSNAVMPRGFLLGISTPVSFYKEEILSYGTPG